MSAADPGRERSRRRIVEWAIVGGLTITALVLGYVGLADVYKAQAYGWSELLYRSLQLFVLESGAVPTGPVPLSLEIARILAPAVAAYAAIRAIILLFSEQAALLGLRFLQANHVVVVGLGDKGFALAKALRAAGERVVVVEREAGNAAIAGCRARDIPVLVGDASDAKLLQRTNVQRARHLVVLAGDDGTNIAVAFVAARLQLHRRARVLTASVHLDDLGLWRLLQPQLLAMRDRLGCRIELFNADADAARVLLEQHAPFSVPRPHLLVVGPGPLVESVIVQAARTWSADAAADGERLRITLAGEAAAAQRNSLIARYPILERRCELDSWELSRGSQEPDPPFTAAFVCLENEPAGLAAALALATRPETRRVPTVLAVQYESAGVATALHEDAGLIQLRPFGVLDRTMTPDLLAQGTHEILARAKHDHYLRCERERGLTLAENPSAVPWHELDESLKESNRLFADSVGLKLEAAGCTLVPAPLADPSAPGFTFSEAEIEEFARAEHERWCRDLLGQGWRAGAQKDARRKFHPKLVPWDELTEDDRDKDREPVAALPEMLARAGFAIERADGVPPTVGAFARLSPRP